MAHDDPRIHDIEQTLQQIQTHWHAGRSAEVYAFYSPAAILTGEGVPIVIDQPEQVRDTVTTLIGADPDAEFTIRRTRVFADNVAETWITVTAAGSGLALRALLVWTRTDDTWRITSEMFAAGDAF